MTLYLFTATAVTVALVLVMIVTHREVEVTSAGIVWLIGPPDDHDDRAGVAR